MASQVLYRFWNDADELLYVGITARPWERWKQHRAEKAWWEEVAKVTIENFATRAEVKAAETVAIKTENPLYNIAERRHVPAPEVVEEEWDGHHVLWVSNYSSTRVYCSCQPIDETECADPILGFDAWAETQPYIRPEDYADHVIESVATERWAQALEKARSAQASGERRRAASVKFILKVWPEHMHAHLPRSWQRYARQWLDQGATRDDVKEALNAAADAFMADRTERPWNYAGGVVARKVRELHGAADSLLNKEGN